jgi:hypothetical protein
MFGNEEWQSIVRELDSSEMRRGQASLAIAPQTTEAIKAGTLELDLINAYKKGSASFRVKLGEKGKEKARPSLDWVRTKPSQPTRRTSDA